jgi:hypothetical protein
MDLLGIQGRLNALGVSLRFEDDPPADAAELVLQRQYRAALYIRRLEDVRRFFTDPLAPGGPAGPVNPLTNGLGADYPFAEDALSSGALLNDLAESLDTWLLAAVDLSIRAWAPRVNNPTPYEGWFTSQIYDPNNALFDQRVANFFLAYPITNASLTRIIASFQDNVATATRRIVDDRDAIAELFSDLYRPWFALNALTRIESTGSDFHKGGRQVLILTFTVALFFGFGPNSNFRLIYKPADLELDCLVAGNSVAVNNAIPGVPAFLQRSLVELFNAEAAAHPAPGLEPLPTYRILPRKRTSTAAGPGLPRLRDAYGYIEYLPHVPKGMSWNAHNAYANGINDYVIGPRMATAPVIARFYHQMGQLLAIALTFSLTDLHYENVRVRGYEPYLIDLEAALTKPIATIGTTSLFGGTVGGISSWDGTKRVKWWDNAVGRADLDSITVRTYQCNRLVRLTRAGARDVVRVDPVYLDEGLRNGLAVLATLNGQADMLTWFARAQNVLVRLLPLGTQDWDELLRNAYSNSQYLGAATPPVATTIADEVLTIVTDRHNRYPVLPGLPAPPEYLAVAGAQATVDLNNFDIPVFYNRNGSADMLDSMGNVMVMPATIVVGRVGNAPVATGFGPLPGGARQTYFAAAPDSARNQLNTLAGAVVGTTATFTGQIVQYMCPGGMPARPAVVL